MALAHDVRDAAHALRRSAGFTTVAIVTLGLVIGATTAIFSVVNAVLLRPLPYPDADRIVQVFQIIERPNVGTPLRGGLTPDQFQIWRDEADAVSQIAVHGVRTFTLTGVAEAVRLNGAAVWAILHRLNMTKNELAKRCGLATGYLSQLLNGKRNPSPATRQSLQEVLGAEFDELFIVEGADGE